MSDKIYLYPLWLRIWHWLNAALFIVLIFTGLNLQYSGKEYMLIEFNTAVAMHNAAGITLSLNYLFFIIFNFISGNFKQYIPSLKGFSERALLQIKYYTSGIFSGAPHPFNTSKDNKFNPLQQVTYLNIMYLMLPVLIISGWALLFPEIIIKEFLGSAGMLLTALVHTTAGFLLSLFMVGHIYLATTGSTVVSNFNSMIHGWHMHHTNNSFQQTNRQSGK